MLRIYVGIDTKNTYVTDEVYAFPQTFITSLKTEDEIKL